MLSLASLLAVPPTARNTATADGLGGFFCENEAGYAAPLFSYKLAACRTSISDGKQIESFITGLPNDGKMYCVPTAAMNCMAFIANHGYPAVERA